jgi:hypothetical protein
MKLLSETKPRTRWRLARVVFAVLALQFFIPAISYIAAPELTVQTMRDINMLLRGGPWPSDETTQLWHMLAVGNVMTLAFLCFLLWLDMVRLFPILPGLVFLKGFSALYSLALGFAHDIPAFFGVFVLDGSTTVLMVVAAVMGRRAWHEMPEEERPLPLWAKALLLKPARVRRSLELLADARVVERVPNLWQITQGCSRMWLRVMFRGDDVGTSADPVRDSWRARLLAWRPLRFPFLVAERAIAPLDMSGLASSRERLIRHILGAHHEGAQLVYDLEILAVHPGALEELLERVRAIVDGSDPRSEWLRDLCVFERYHELVLERTERALAGDFMFTDDDLRDPDISLRAYLEWCAQQPAAP